MKTNRSKFFTHLLSGVAGGSLLFFIFLSGIVVTSSPLLKIIDESFYGLILVLIICALGSYLGILVAKKAENNKKIILTSLLLLAAIPVTLMIGIEIIATICNSSITFCPNTSDSESIAVLISLILSLPFSIIASTIIISCQKNRLID